MKYIRIFRPSFSILCGILFFIFSEGFYHFSHAGDDKVYKSLKLFTDILEEIEENYVDDIDTEEMIHNAIKGMIKDLDPYSSFMPPEAFSLLKDNTRAKFSGIGISITIKNNFLTVVSPIEGTPAYKAGIMAGDIIIEIDREPTKDVSLWEAVKKIRGPRYKKVLITVARKGQPKPIEFAVKRDIIPIESVRSSIVRPGYGYLRIMNFRANTFHDVKKHLKQLESGEEGLKGLIMDLRNNPGGLLDQAVKISDLFLDQGTIVSIKKRKESEGSLFKAHPGKEDRKYPVVILINKGSASASEIVAGALRDNLRALILGTKSFGKGSVQIVKSLGKGFGLKYTIARYYTPSGESIHDKGILPDIEVEYEITAQEDKSTEESLRSEEKGTDRPKDILLQDSQVRSALHIIVSYGIFSRLNER